MFHRVLHIPSNQISHTIVVLSTQIDIFPYFEWNSERYGLSVRNEL